MNKEHFSSYFLSIQNLNLDILKLISSNFTIFSPFQSPLWTVLRKPSSKWDLYMWLASNNALKPDESNAYFYDGSGIILSIRSFMGFKIIVSRSGFIHSSEHISGQKFSQLTNLLLKDLEEKYGKHFIFLYCPVCHENPSETFCLLQNNFKKISLPGSTNHSLTLDTYIQSRKVKKELKYYKTGLSVNYSSEILGKNNISEILMLHQEMREKKNLPSDDFVSRDCLTRLSSLFSNDIKLFCLRSDSGDMLAYSLWYQQKYAYYLRGAVSTSDSNYHSLGYYLMDQILKSISVDSNVTRIDLGGIGFTTNEESVLRFKSQFSRNIVSYQQNFIYSTSSFLSRLLRKMLSHLLLWRSE